MPRPHVFVFVWRRGFFLLLKYLHPHVAFLSRFCPSTFTIITQTIMHLVYPPKILHNHFFQCSRPKRKTRPLLCKTLEGIIRCIVVYVKMLNWKTQWYLKKVCTVFDGSMRIYWYPTLWRNRFQKLFSSNHTSAAKWLFQKSLLRGALLKRFFFRWPFLPDTCGR